MVDIRTFDADKIHNTAKEMIKLLEKHKQRFEWDLILHEVTETVRIVQDLAVKEELSQ